MKQLQNPMQIIEEKNHINRELRLMAKEDFLALKVREETGARASKRTQRLREQRQVLAKYDSDEQRWIAAVNRRYKEYITHMIKIQTPEIITKWINLRNRYGFKSIHRLCQCADLQLVSVLLEQGADPLDPLNDGRTSFHLAVEAGSLVLVRKLLNHLHQNKTEKEKDLAVNATLATTSHSNSLLHIAARKGHYQILELLLDSVPEYLELKAQEDGCTPLHLAIMGGHLSCIKLLLDRGANLATETKEGVTGVGLGLCTSFRVNKVFEFIMQNTPDKKVFEKWNAQGLNALHQALLGNYRSIAIYMIENKIVPLDSCAADGRAALHIATYNEDIELIQMLIQNGAFIDVIDNNGQTPLLYACTKPHLESMNFFIFNGADLRHQDRQGHSALHLLAAFCQSKEAFITIIGGGATVDARSAKMNTPLHVAALNGNMVAARMLLLYDADLNAVTIDNRSVLYLARKWRHAELEEFIKQKNLERLNRMQLRITTDIAMKMFSKTRNIRLKRESLKDTTTALDKTSLATSSFDRSESSTVAPSGQHRRFLVNKAAKAGKLTPFLKRQMEMNMQLNRKVSALPNKRPTTTGSTKTALDRYLDPLEERKVQPRAAIYQPEACSIPWKMTAPTSKRTLERVIKPCLSSTNTRARLAQDHKTVIRQKVHWSGASIAGFEKENSSFCT